MKRFTLFGSRILFWLLTPLVVAGIVGFLYLSYLSYLDKRSMGVMCGIGLSLFLLFFLLWSVFPRQFGWMSIFITGSIAGAYIWYFCDTYFVQHQPIKPSDTGAPSSFNALHGFFEFGLPCLIYTVWRVRALLVKKHHHDT